MSMELIVEAKLCGYEGPIDVSTQELQNTLEPESFNIDGHFLVRACNTIVGHEECLRPITSDGYLWFSAHFFTASNSGTVVVLIPWFQDWRRESGSRGG